MPEARLLERNVRAREQGRPSFGASPNLESTFEIKSSVADFISRPLDKLFFAVPESVPIEIMPEDAGLILADAYGAEILHKANRMASATCRASGAKATDALHVGIEAIINN